MEKAIIRVGEDFRESLSSGVSRGGVGFGGEG